ncbi:MAG: glutaredoxin domain-containing protein [bacterium]
MIQSKVIVYSTTWCAFCKATKQYLDSKNIKYKEVNIEEDQVAAQQIVEETGQMGVPVIRIGKELIVGFNKQKIDAALQIA